MKFSQPDSRLKLMLAAESLVSENGYGAVSVRMIIRRAGMKNTSAIHYHFGSLERLYEALIHYRMAELESARAFAIRQIKRERGELNLHDCANLICLPHLEISNEGRFTYAGFLTEIITRLYPGGFPWVMRGESRGFPDEFESLRTILSSLREYSPEQEEHLFHRRVANATILFLNLLRTIGKIENRTAELDNPLITDALIQFRAIIAAPSASHSS